MLGKVKESRETMNEAPSAGHQTPEGRCAESTRPPSEQLCKIQSILEDFLGSVESLHESTQDSIEGHLRGVAEEHEQTRQTLRALLERLNQHPPEKVAHKQAELIQELRQLRLAIEKVAPPPSLAQNPP